MSLLVAVQVVLKVQEVVEVEQEVIDFPMEQLQVVIQRGLLL